MGAAFNFYLVRPKEDGSEWTEEELIENHEAEREKCILAAGFAGETGDCASDDGTLWIYDDVHIKLDANTTWEDLELIKKEEAFDPYPMAPESGDNETIGKIVEATGGRCHKFGPSIAFRLGEGGWVVTGVYKD